MPKQYIEIVVALVIAAASGLGLIEAGEYPGESSYVPLAVLIFSILLAVAWMAQSLVSLRRQAVALAIQRKEVVRFLLFASVAVGYGVCFYLVGFYTSTFLMIPLAAGLLGYRRWKVSVATAAVFLIVLNIVFNLLLKTPLPPELIFRLKEVL